MRRRFTINKYPHPRRRLRKQSSHRTRVRAAESLTSLPTRNPPDLSYLILPEQTEHTRCLLVEIFTFLSPSRYAAVRYTRNAFGFALGPRRPVILVITLFSPASNPSSLNPAAAQHKTSIVLSRTCDTLAVQLLTYSSRAYACAAPCPNERLDAYILRIRSPCWPAIPPSASLLFCAGPHHVLLSGTAVQPRPAELRAASTAELWSSPGL